MKYLKTIGLMIFLLAGHSLSDDELILDEAFGLNQAIQVLDYDGNANVVKIKKDSDVSSRPLNDFSESEQKEILEWASDIHFTKDISISLEEKEKPRSSTSKLDVSYIDVEIKNAFNAEYTNLDAVLVAFFELTNDQEKKYYQVSRWKIEIAPGETATRSSEPVWARSGRLEGAYLQLRRVDRHGNLQILQQEIGSVPDKDERLAYRDDISNKAFLIKDELRKYEKQDDWVSAYLVCRHYSYLRDIDNTKEWAEETRERYEDNPSGRSQMHVSDVDQFVIDAQTEPPIEKLFEQKNGDSDCELILLSENGDPIEPKEAVKEIAKEQSSEFL